MAPIANNLGTDDRELLDFSLKVDYETPIGTLTSISSYSQVDLLVTFDGFDYSANDACIEFASPLNRTGIPCADPRFVILVAGGDPDNPADVLFEQDFNTTFQDNELENWSQEIRLTSPGNQRLRYIVGAYVLGRDRSLVTGTQEDLGFGIIPELDFDPATPNETRGFFAEENDDIAYAFFGQVNYDILPNLELSVSVRYDRDEREQFDPRPDAFRVDGFGLPITTPRTRQATFDAIQPKATISYEPTDDLTVYATYAEGFRSGGFNAPGTEVNPFTGEPIADSIYGEEQTRGGELGFKTRWLDGQLTVNGAVFYTDADDLQVFNFNGAVNAQVITTLDDVNIWGVELEWVWATPYGLDLFGSFGYNDAEIKAAAANPAAVGNQVPFTTEWTLHLGAQHVLDLPGSFSLVTRADWEHRGNTFFHAGGTPVGVPIREPLDFVSARVAIEHDKGWALAGWGKNLLDEQYFEEVIVPDFSFQGRPRTYGVELTVDF